MYTKPIIFAFRKLNTLRLAKVISLFIPKFNLSCNIYLLLYFLLHPWSILSVCQSRLPGTPSMYSPILLPLLLPGTPETYMLESGVHYQTVNYVCQGLPQCIVRYSNTSFFQVLLKHICWSLEYITRLSITSARDSSMYSKILQHLLLPGTPETYMLWSGVHYQAVNYDCQRLLMV